jgi:type II secretory pathway pseudopilin PulG
VAIGIIAILAAAAVPLVMKALNQQREQKTRDSLKIAWEAMFGARDRRVANMQADFGFVPLAANVDLRQMMTKPAVVPIWYSDASAGGMRWGWNGPYWTGSTRQTGGAILPVDGWGHPIAISYNQNNQLCQLRSDGPDGRANTGDDIYYPPNSTNVGNSTLSLTIRNDSRTSTTLAGTYQVRYRNGSGALTNSTTTAFSNIAYGGTLNPSFQAAQGPDRKSVV